MIMMMMMTMMVVTMMMIYCSIEMKTKSMVEAKTPDMMMCRFSGGILRSARLRLGGQLLNRTRRFSLEWTNHHVRGLSLDLLLEY